MTYKHVFLSQSDTILIFISILFYQSSTISLSWYISLYLAVLLLLWRLYDL